VENGNFKFEKIVIGDDCHVSAFTIILPGVTMQQGSATRPCTLLLSSDSLPPQTVWAGNPSAFVSIPQPPRHGSPAGRAIRGESMRRIDVVAPRSPANHNNKASVSVAITIMPRSPFANVTV
jgi:hypothetical protein